jgi:hypothetical protein
MNDSDLLSLYTSFKDDARGWLSLHRQHFTQFVVIILGVLGATIAAFVQLRQEGVVLLILIIGPLLSSSLSVLAIFVCDKFYTRYAEHDAISYKFYCLLEIRSGLKEDLQAVKDVYRGQDDVFPVRWVGRLREAGSVDEYAKGRLRAHDASNRCIMFTFAKLVAASAILTLVIVLSAVL